MSRHSQPRLRSRSARFSRLGQFLTRGRSVDRALEHKRDGRRLTVETLEDRRLLAADIDTNLSIFEPHLAVNPVNPANVVATQFNQLAISTDYGQTFTAPLNAAVLPAALQAAGYGFGGDPVLAFNTQGTTLFWAYLASVNAPAFDRSVIVQRINPLTGASLGSVDLAPGNFNEDKCWLAVDDNPLSPNVGNVYVVWSRLVGDRDEIRFSRSIDGGVTFSAPMLLSDPDGADNVVGVHPITLINDDEEFPWPSHVETAPNGDVFVAYHIDARDNDGAVTNNDVGDNPNGGPIVVLRSSDAGVTFAQKTTAFDPGEAQINDNRQDEATTIANTNFWTLGALRRMCWPIRCGPDGFTSSGTTIPTTCSATATKAMW